MTMPTKEQIDAAKEIIAKDTTEKEQAAIDAAAIATKGLEEAEADAIIKEADAITKYKDAQGKTDDSPEKQAADAANEALKLAREKVDTLKKTADEKAALIPAKPQPASLPVATPTVIAGLNENNTNLLDGNYHFGVAVDVTASGIKSTLMVPDAKGVGNGDSPVFITKPIRIKGANLNNFLAKKGISPPKEAANLLKDTSINLNAFYFCNDHYDLDDKGKRIKDEGGVKDKDPVKKGATLVSFEIAFDKGIISALTDDDAFQELFDITGASLRVLRCDKDSLPELQAYVKELTAKD